MTVIALINHSGRVGKAILAQLVKGKGQEHTIVILHRAGSDISSIPAGIETRVIDFEGSEEELIKSISGVEVLISALPTEAAHTQLKLIAPLAKSPTLKLFIPSDFGTNWTPAELSLPSLAFLGGKAKVAEALKENGIPFVEVRAGGFVEFVFGSPFAGIDVKTNKLELYKGAEDHPLHLTIVPHLGTATANLALHPSPSTLNGQKFNIVHLTPTGNDIVKVFTKIHNGTPSEVTEFTEQAYEGSLAAGGFAALAAAFKRKWATDTWNAGELTKGSGVGEVEDLETVIRQFA